MSDYASRKIVGGPYDSTYVVEEIGGFPRGDKAVDAAFFASMTDSLITSGIVDIDGHQFEVTPGDGLSINIAPGVAWARGYMAKLNSEMTVELAAGHSFAVFIRQDPYSGEARIITLADDYSHIPTRNHAIYDMVLAIITVPEGAENVTSDMISDRRSQGVCGYVASRL